MFIIVGERLDSEGWATGKFSYLTKEGVFGTKMRAEKFASFADAEKAIDQELLGQPYNIEIRKVQ